MTCTLQMDGMGYLHVWRGDVSPRKVGSYLYKADGKEAELLIMGDEDIHSFMENLSKYDIDYLERGYSVTTKNIPTEYFTTK